jgi:hypothetical protein
LTRRPISRTLLRRDTETCPTGPRRIAASCRDRAVDADDQPAAPSVNRRTPTMALSVVRGLRAGLLTGM